MPLVRSQFAMLVDYCNSHAKRNCDVMVVPQRDHVGGAITYEKVIVLQECEQF